MLRNLPKITTLIVLAVVVSAMLIVGVGCDLSGEKDQGESNGAKKEVTLALYFMKDGELAKVERTATDVEDATEAAITELLKGPSEEETDYETAIPENTELVNIEVEDGKATVSFSNELDEDARRQVEETIKANNEEVTEVEIKTSSEEKSEEEPTVPDEDEKAPQEEGGESSE